MAAFMVITIIITINIIVIVIITIIASSPFPSQALVLFWDREERPGALGEGGGACLL